MKKKLYQISNKLINANNIKIAILFIPLTIIIVNEIIAHKFVLNDFYDTSILISFLIVFICEGIANLILGIVGKITEDDVKLETDYKSLANKYEVEKSKMVIFKNKEQEVVYIPVVTLMQRNINDEVWDINIELDKNKSKYILPKQIADNSSKIFTAHANSVVFNNRNIRLNDLAICDGKIVLTYGFTTYFDSLLTNRAMDYQFISGRTVREIYEPGPFLSTLSESKLSNHLGFNGFVELSDGNIIFVKRGNKLSIAKGLWQQSVGASLKTKYCINDKHELTIKGISKAICMEINDELKLGLSYEKEQFEHTIFAFYRDLVEGGKPQFLFYYKMKECNKEQFITNFKNEMKKKKQKKENAKKQNIDGSNFAFFKLEELKQCNFSENYMITRNNDKYRMMPSSIASIIMLLNNANK